MPIPPGSPADGPAAAPQRIFFTELTVGGVVGGSLTGILELLAHLDRRRFEPVMVFFEPKPVIADLEARGITVHVLPGPRGALPLRGSLPKRAVARTAELFRVVLPRVREFVRFFRRERPAVVYACNGLAPSVPVLAAAGLCGIPVVCHVKGFSHYRPDARFVSRWIDTAIGMTDEIVEHVRAQGIRARRFLTIHDGIDLASPPRAAARPSVASSGYPPTRRSSASSATSSRGRASSSPSRPSPGPGGRSQTCVAWWSAESIARASSTRRSCAPA